MNGTEGTLDPADDLASSLEKFFQAWLDMTDRWMEWERREVILGQPSERVLAKHRSELRWVLRSVRMNSAVIKDPEFPFPKFARELDGRLLQLEDSWKLIHGQTMTDDEADQVLKTAFSDER